VNYLQNFPKLALCEIVCTIDETAREELAAMGFAIADLHVICAECCIGTAFFMAFRQLPGRPGIRLYRLRPGRRVHALFQAAVAKPEKGRCGNGR